MLLEILSNKKVKLAGMLLLAGATLLIGWSIYYANFVFHITGTDPALNSVAAISPYFRINFSQPIDASSVDLSMDPNVITSTSVDGKKLTVYLNNMSVGVNYTITLSHVKNLKGKELTNQTFFFVAKNIDFSKLSKEQQALILTTQDKSTDTNRDPIFQYMPHSTLNYELSAVVGGGGDSEASTVSIDAQILLNGADVRGGKDAAVAKYKQQIVDYLKSIKIDPNNYVINYEVVEPAY